MSKLLSDKYAYRVIWSEEDGEYVGLCAELPSLSWLDKSRAEALEGIVKLARDVVAEMAESGEKQPQPLTDKKYSGIFKVRIPCIVHRNLALEAADAGVSINRLVSAKLAHGGETHVVGATAEPRPSRDKSPTRRRRYSDAAV